MSDVPPIPSRTHKGDITDIGGLGNMLADGTDTYRYDAWNRLVEVDRGSDALAACR